MNPREAKLIAYSLVGGGFAVETFHRWQALLATPTAEAAMWTCAAMFVAGCALCFVEELVRDRPRAVRRLRVVPRPMARRVRMVGSESA